MYVVHCNLRHLFWKSSLTVEVRDAEQLMRDRAQAVGSSVGSEV